ncbi:MAG: Hsp20/alpha crystallin family protein [Thermodesulfobacteriota bacterium]|jgi:HSP20 family protein
MFTRISDIDRMFGAMDLLRNKMDRVFSDYGRSYLSDPAFTLRSNSPRTNLLESGDTFEVQAEVPGISKDDLNIKIQGNYLEISGKRSVDTPEGYKIHRNERGSSSFSRSFSLPDEIDAEKVEAALKDGILYLKLPKSETAKPKMIEINAA